MGYISEVLSFVETAYVAAEVIVKEALRQYNSKINLIDDPSTLNIIKMWRILAHASSFLGFCTAVPPRQP